jgi:ATP phosphoribosyltransferase regulatory subunit
MTNSAEKALLPAGLQDLLPPDAAHEATILERLVAAFASFGYERVKPPLMEFEETLLSGAGRAVAKESFRLMDPVSQRMMALRADITPQVARIAATRLQSEPRPLRLCYGGQVLRVRGGQLRPERQFAQAGAELIGAPQEAGDAEVVVLAVSALEAVGVRGLTADLSLPTLVPAVTKGLAVEDDAAEALRQALDRKDAEAVTVLSGSQSGLFEGLLRAAGPADQALSALQALGLPEEGRGEVEKLARVVTGIRRESPEVSLTIDPVEHRGFEYHTGISFTFFARDVRGELGRGGRYLAEGFGAQRETSTGFTLYMDTVLRALPAADRAARIFLPAGSDPKTSRSLREQGWPTLSSLEPAVDPLAEARRLGCSHALIDGQIQEIE